MQSARAWVRRAQLARGLSVASRYAQVVAQHGWSKDAAQLAAVARLDKCLARVRDYARRRSVVVASPQSHAVATTDSGVQITEHVGGGQDGHAPPPQRVPRGLYLHGSVGTGKSMLMDLFHAEFQKAMQEDGAVLPSRRVHFNTFMLEVHRRIHAWKRGLLATHGREEHVSLAPERDAITHVGHALAAEATLLCFDEFQV